MNKLLLIMVSAIVIAFSCSNNKKETEQQEESKTTKTDETKPEEPKRKSKYEIRKELEGSFASRTHNGIKQVRPKFVGDYDEGIFCFFVEKNKKVISLSLNIKYSEYKGDLFELISGTDTMRYKANHSHTSSMSNVVGGNKDLQWYAKVVNQEDEAFIRKIGESKKATLNIKDKEKGEIVGTVTLSKAECQALVDAVDYYIASNGAKIPKKGMVNIRGN